MKRLNKRNLSDEIIGELVAECEVGLILDHPLVCRLLRIYESDVQVTLVSEFCSGGDMFARLEALGPYSEPMAQSTCIPMYALTPR